MSPVSVVVLNMLCTPRGAIELDVLGNDTIPAWACDCRLPCLRMLGESSVSGIVTPVAQGWDTRRMSQGREKNMRIAMGDFDVRHL